MQARKPSNSNQSSRKGVGSRVGTQPNTAPVQPPATVPVKEKDDSLFLLVKEYLEKNGYARTFQTFKTEKPLRKNTPASYQGGKSHQGFQHDEEKTILQVLSLLYAEFR